MTPICGRCQKVIVVPEEFECFCGDEQQEEAVERLTKESAALQAEVEKAKRDRDEWKEAQIKLIVKENATDNRCYDLEQKVKQLEADNQRMREVVSAGILELRDAGKHGVAEYMKTSLLPDSCWLKRHDAETRRKAFEEVYKKMGDTPANVYFNFVDWVRSQIKALELQGVDKE